jgi:hypothetical protein
MVPRKTHYNMVSGEIMPDITCTSECNPPCSISWGEHSKNNILSLGVVTTEDTGEYTCTARRLDGHIVEQTVSVYVNGICSVLLNVFCKPPLPSFSRKTIINFINDLLIDLLIDF